MIKKPKTPKTPKTPKQTKRREKIKSKAIQVFKSIARGLVKVWLANKSFIITKEDAINLTLEQLKELAEIER